MSQTLSEYLFSLTPAEIATHPADCPEDEGFVYAMRDCPFREPLHYDKDGCRLALAKPRTSYQGKQASV
jgi:hypothetical protein